MAVQHQAVRRRGRLGEPPALPVLQVGPERFRVTGRVQVIRPVAGLDELVVLANAAVETVIVEIVNAARRRSSSPRPRQQHGEHQPQHGRHRRRVVV